MASNVSDAIRAALRVIEETAKMRDDVWLFEYAQLLSDAVHSDDVAVSGDAIEAVVRTLTKLVR